jgi:hypothetical protein
VRVGLTVLAHAAGATVAASDPALLLSTGATMLAEGAIVAHRASTSGGHQWQARVFAVRCMNPASTRMPFFRLTVPFEAESSAVVRFSVSGAVSFAGYSAGSDNLRYQ